MLEHLNPKQGEHELENIDAQIQQLDMKAQSSSGTEKMQYLSKIRELIVKKDSQNFSDKTRGFSEKFGL